MLDPPQPEGSSNSSGSISSTSCFNFCLEDTADRSYRFLINGLTDRNWKKVPHRRRTKLEKKRLPMKEVPVLIWTLNEKDVDFAELLPFQVCNHYEGITQLTTKRGFCELLKDMSWINQEALEVSPRCYNLGDPLHREEFIEDFRITAAASILKRFITHHQHQHRPQTVPPPQTTAAAATTTTTTELPSRALLQKCISACSRYLRVKMQGEWPGVERGFDCQEHPDAGQINIYGLEDQEWTSILQACYANTAHGNSSGGGSSSDSALSSSSSESSSGGVALGGGREVTSASIRSLIMEELANYTSQQQQQQQQQEERVATVENVEAAASSSSSSNASTLAATPATSSQPRDTLRLKILFVLRALSSVNRQFDIDGCKNIWVVKAPEACRGLGLKVLYRLEDILECERGMGGRTVQKYVETPLLAPLYLTPSQVVPMMMKFDLRVWVLVTCFEPLQAYIYSRVYGRRCGSSYDDSVKSLSDGLVHLTNYSIQKKNQALTSTTTSSSGASASMASAATVEEESSSNSSAVKKLRSVCDTFRSDVPGTVSQSDLLLGHDDILHVIGSKFPGKEAKVLWEQQVWPEIKQKVLVTLEATKASVVARDKSFELLGYDVLLDNSLTAWILEVNMSPAMAHRSDEQSALIAQMSEGLLKLAVLPHTGTPLIPPPPEPDFSDLASQPQQPTTPPRYNNSLEALSQKPFGLPPSEGHNFYSGTSPATSKRQQQPGGGGSGDGVLPSSLAAFGQWEPFSTPTKMLLPTPPPPPPILDGLVLNKPSNDWAVVARPQSAGALRPPRPKSANQTRRPVAAGGFSFGTETAAQAYTRAIGGTTNVNLDVSFAVVGRVVSTSSIRFFDCLCNNFAHVLLLQRWALRYIMRLRLYHSKRKRCCTAMQAGVRMFLAKCALYHLKRARAARWIQNILRRRAAYLVLLFKFKTVASTKIQCCTRKLLARRRVRRLKRHYAAIRLQRWFRTIRLKWQRRAAFKIVWQAKKWLQWRRKCARKVFHLIALFYRRRLRYTLVIQRGAQQWLESRKRRRVLMRKFAESAARKGREWTLRFMALRRQREEVESKLSQQLAREWVAEQVGELVALIAVETWKEAVVEAEEEAAAVAAAALQLESEKKSSTLEEDLEVYARMRKALPHTVREFSESLFGDDFEEYSYSPTKTTKSCKELKEKRSQREPFPESGSLMDFMMRHSQEDEDEEEGNEGVETLQRREGNTEEVVAGEAKVHGGGGVGEVNASVPNSSWLNERRKMLFGRSADDSQLERESLEQMQSVMHYCEDNSRGNPAGIKRPSSAACTRTTGAESKATNSLFGPGVAKLAAAAYNRDVVEPSLSKSNMPEARRRPSSAAATRAPAVTSSKPIWGKGGPRSLLAPPRRQAVAGSTTTTGETKSIKKKKKKSQQKSNASDMPMWRQEDDLFLFSAAPPNLNHWRFDDEGIGGCGGRAAKGGSASSSASSALYNSSDMDSDRAKMLHKMLEDLLEKSERTVQGSFGKDISSKKKGSNSHYY